MIKTEKEIVKYATALVAQINECHALMGTQQFAFELGKAEGVIDEMQMDSGLQNREYVTDEFFLYGSNRLPLIKSAVTKAVNNWHRANKKPLTPEMATTIVEQLKKVFNNVFQVSQADTFMDKPCACIYVARFGKAHVLELNVLTEGYDYEITPIKSDLIRIMVF